MKHRITLFGKQVDFEQNILLYKGQEQSIEPRIAKLLRILYEHQGTVMNKGELIKALWPETIVTEDSLTKAVSKLRKLLDQDQRNSAIKTVNGVGYMLRKPGIAYRLKASRSTIVLTSIVVFLLYVLLGSGLVEWAIDLKSHLSNP